MPPQRRATLQARVGCSTSHVLVNVFGWKIRFGFLVVRPRFAPTWRLERRALAATRADVAADRRRQSRDRWSNAFDVGHVGNPALWSVLARKAITRSLFDEPLVEPGPDPQHGLAMNLANARLADLEDLADLAQVELLIVIKRQHEALALG